MKAIKDKIIIVVMLILGSSCAAHKIKYNVSKETAAFIKTCADSINNAEKTKVLPVFLFDPCFDFNDPHTWVARHHAIPLRSIISEKVTNASSIEYILDQHNPELQRVCPLQETDKVMLMYWMKSPQIEKSFEQLLKVRYEELTK